MPHPKIDFLKQKYDLPEPDQKPFIFLRKTFVITLICFATLGSIFSYRVSTTAESKGGLTPFSFFAAVRSMMTPGDDKLIGEENDRVNFLFTGIGGEGHDGPQLTDTILFASFRPSTKKIAFMSLPRDMTVPIPGHGYQKVNAANAYGEMEKPGSGPIVATQVIGDILKQDIQYYIRVDFNGFAELIDSLSGIDVYVDRSFSDSSYPILGKEDATCSSTSTVVNTDLYTPKPISNQYGCRFENLTFKEGWTHMNGDLALKYVRSRHGNNGEGSDFARSRRQQKVLMSVKDKVFSIGTFLNPSRIGKILNTLKNNISTNLSVSEIVRLAKELKDVKQEEVVQHVIDASENSPLYSASVNGAYVLLPKNVDWTQLQKMAQYIFTPSPENNIANAKTQKIEEPIPEPTPILQPEKPKQVLIEIQNGTNTTGLAFRASQLLGSQGYTVIKVGNAQNRNYLKTIIYDLTDGEQSDELNSLKEFFKADVTSSSVGWKVSNKVIPKELSLSKEEISQITTEQQVDFLVILGEYSTNLSQK